ncbi:hypothetical protein [Saccharococcus sp. Marseille-Q5394]|uniref:hypothetical protein n=1 Tax=Saccharococcus sp. Marseille-Q5394 TaxID=2972778 RepID=UPI0021C886F6|nr:hypothetical protein [Saccharococcus sp. Marseille-Q5394]
MHRWKLGIAIVFILGSLLVAGCSKPEPQDENIEVIKTVLEIDLNAPDEEAIRLLEEPYKSKEAEEAGEGFLEEYYKYQKETYEPYFTESGLEQFIMTNQAFMFHRRADQHGYQLEVKNIEVEQNEVTPTNYNFTVTLDYEMKDEDKKEIEMSGIAIVRDGKVAKITYHIRNHDELKNLLYGEQK